MLDETNCSLDIRGLFNNKEDLFSEIKSLTIKSEIPVTIKSEILNQEEQIKSIQDMVNLGYLVKVDEMPSLSSDLMGLGLLVSNKIKKSKKTGIASTLDEESTRQPSKGKIYGRRFNGRFASKAIYRYHNQKFKNNHFTEVFKKNHKYQQIGELVVECGLTWTRVDHTRAIKTLEALRLPCLSSQESMSSQKIEFEEYSDMEPQILHDDFIYDYDDVEPSPPLPPPSPGFTCGMDHCRLGCVCQSINGVQKKLLKRDHCCQYQCMFSCHCQHLTRSRATLFGNLSPIMDSKFSFTKLNKTTIPTKKKLFNAKKPTCSEDSGDEIRRKETEKSSIEPLEIDVNKSDGCVRKSGRIKDKVLYNNLDSEDAIEGEIKEEKIVPKKRVRRKRKSLTKIKSSDVSESCVSPPKNAPPVDDCLEISSDSDDDIPPTKKNKSANLSVDKKYRDDGFKAPLLYPTGNFYMERVLVKKMSEIDGSRQDLLVESYHDFNWQYCKMLLSGLFHRNVFTKNGICRDKKNIEWNNFNILLHPVLNKSSIPKSVQDKLENPNFEYVKAIVIKSSSSKNEILVINSPVKSSDSEESRILNQSNQSMDTSPTRTPTPTKSKCDDVIVVDDDVEVLSDASDCHDIINKVSSLAPNFQDSNKQLSPIKDVPKASPIKDVPKASPIKDVPKASPKRAPSLLNDITSKFYPPTLHVPFCNATGISGCRQFKFNALRQKPSVIPSNNRHIRAILSKKYHPIQSTSLSNPAPQQKLVDSQSGMDISKKDDVKEVLKIQPKLNGQLSHQKILSTIQQFPNNSTTIKPPPFVVNNCIRLIRMSPVLKSNPIIASPSPINIALTKNLSPTQPEQNRNMIIVQPSKVTPPRPALISNEIDRKKIIVLKHVPSILSPRFYSPGNFPPRAMAPTNSVISTSLPISIPTVRPLAPPIITLNSKPILLPPIAKVSISTPSVVENNSTTVVSRAIEIPDSDEEKNIKRNNFPSTKNSDGLECVKPSVISSNYNGLQKTILGMNGDSKQSKDESNIDSKSPSLQSDNGNDEHQLYLKRLKLLYQEITKIDSSQEKHDKLRPGDILEMVLGTVKKLQDTNVKLANERLSECETMKKLSKKLQELKNDAKAPE